MTTTFGVGASTQGLLARVGVDVAVVRSRWEVRAGVGTDGEGRDCGPGLSYRCRYGVGGGASVMAVRHLPGGLSYPFLGVGGGYAWGPRAPTFDAVGGLDTGLGRWALLRLQAQYRVAFTGTMKLGPGNGRDLLPTIPALHQVTIGLGLGSGFPDWGRRPPPVTI